MRHWSWFALTAACGQVYQAQGSQAAPVPAQMNPVAVDPGTSVDPGGSVEPGPADPAEARTQDGAEPAKAGGAPRATSEQTAWLDAHNKARARHCARPLGWSPKLAQVAQRWANSLRDRGCQFGHSGGNFGENLAAGTSGTLDPAQVVKMWYDEVSQYRFPDGGFSMQTGHFTQLVWRGTTAVGCGRSQCKGMDIYVCEYDPAGNWEGKYRENVLPADCRK